MRYCLLGLLMALVGVAGADPWNTLELSVKGRTEAQREAALRDGLNTMLGRLTGKPSVSDSALAETAARQLDRWVDRYHYQGEKTLVAKYHNRALLDFLGRQGEPVWELPRPRVLLWLVVQGAGRGEVLSVEHPLHEILQQAAQRRGLALVFPEWDQQDQSALTVADVRGRFDEQLQQASQRYPHELIVPGVLYPGNPATVSWRLLRDGKILEKGREKRDQHQQALTALVEQLTDQLADRYTVTASEQQAYTRLQVDGVTSLAAWQSLQRFLSNLSGMGQVRLARVAGARLTYNLDFRASESQLRRSLERSSQLRACPDDRLAGPQWHYCWQP